MTALTIVSDAHAKLTDLIPSSRELGDTRQHSAIDKVKEVLGVDVLLFLDLETFYAKDNKVLRENDKGKMTRVQYRMKSGTSVWEYILDDMFQFTGISFAADNSGVISPPTQRDVAPTIKKLAELIEAERRNGIKIALVAHNVTFDGACLAWHYGLEFDAYVCTMMVEKMFDSNVPASLGASVARYTNDHAKTNELEMADGLRLEEMTPEVYEHQRTYCANDTDILRELFVHQVERGVPDTERRLMNITARAACIPQFCIKESLLKEVVVDIDKDRDAKVLAAANHCLDREVWQVSPATFSSNDKYAGLLQKLGLEVPQKRSPSTGKFTLALGKTDPGYVKMQLQNPEHAPVYIAREVVKSTIAKSRANKMVKAAQLFKTKTPFAANMPMFLNYYGAENTGRWSGGAGLNQQNLQRGSKHRLSLCAQPKYVIAVSDLSQIELRMNLWFCGQTDVIEEYHNNPNYDVYSNLAESIYNRPIDKKLDPDERQIGKAGCLGLGYAMSWYGFQQYLAGGPLGMEPQFVDDAFAKQVKWSYEARNFMIVKMWETIEAVVLPVIANGGSYAFGPNGCVRAEKDKIILPSGRVLHYPNTRITHSGNEHSFKVRYTCDNHKGTFVGTRNLWHGLIIENIIQALARDVLGYQMVLIDDQMERNGYGWVIGSVHDEVLAMVEQLYADEGFALMQKIMAMRPHWCQDLPLASEGGYDVAYSK